MIRFRGDIEGLRAVAVLLVIFDHLDVRGFHGGFTGVDVFFVISGYLITSLLCAEYATKAALRSGLGSISIGGFYLRRARRILPAALTVTAAILIASHFLLNVLRVQQVRHDALWATLFASNINFIRQSTNYFGAGLAASSPFRHYWSLSVEEQFYFVWPALFLLVTKLHGFTVRGRSIGWRARVGITLGLVGLSSFVWSVKATSADPVSAYFSTLTRAWELALGALIGVATTRGTVISFTRATVASLAGAGLLLASCVIIDGGSAFPGYLALLPTVGAALLIVGGLSERLPAPNRIMSIAPMRFVGKISYSLYLWHWPLIVFGAAMYPHAITRPETRVAIFGLTIVISTVSYYVVERPFRRMSFPRAAPWFDQLPGRFKRHDFATLKIVGAIAALVAVSVGLGVAVAQTGTQGGTASGSSRGSVAIPPNRSAPTPKPRTRTATPKQSQTHETPLSRWEQKVSAALAIRSVPPSLQPISNHLTPSSAPCNDFRLAITAHEQECAWGNPSARHVIAITGDSHAGMWLSTLEQSLDPRQWLLHPFTRSWCGWSGGSGNLGAEGQAQNGDCAALQAQTLRELKKLHVDVVILSETGVHSQQQMTDALADYAAVAKTVVVLGHTPVVDPSFSDCLRGANDVSDCRGYLSTNDLDDVALEQQAAGLLNDPFIDTTPWFCAGLTCPPIIDNAPAFTDGSHISTDIAPKFAPVLRESLHEAGVLPP